MSAKESIKVATITVEIDVFDESQGWYDFDPYDDGSDGYWGSIITEHIRDSIKERPAGYEVSFRVTSTRWQLLDKGV